MRLLIVPHSADAHSARLWLGAIDTPSAPSDFDLVIQGGNPVPVHNANWRAVTAGGTVEPADSRMLVQVVEVRDLPSGTRFVAHAFGVQAKFSTLPNQLPLEGAKPFNVLLTSCFFIDRTRGLAVGAAVDALPEHLGPDVKILCGDQVYLDFPAFIVGLPITEHGLGKTFLDKYRRNWGDAAGYQKLLAEGCSYFTADDHEFWNNYPNRATLIGNTFIPGGRERLKKVVLPLFRDFQCEAPEMAGRNRRFDVPPLSFLVADTRVNRREGDDEFMSPEDLKEMLDWIRGLRGPGVLVVGQPVFETPANFLAKRLADRKLPNYKQYSELVRALHDATHSVLILTGDVHYGRVARIQFRKTAGSPEIGEVIASPSSIVFGGPVRPKPVKRFPPEATTGVPDARILQDTGPVRAGDHFATLHFTSTGGRVIARVRHWYLREPGGARSGDEAKLELF